MPMLEEVLKKAIQLHEELAVYKVRIEHVEKGIDELTKANKEFLDKLSKDSDDLSRRLTTLEGLMDSTLAKSLKEALTTVLREYLENKGKLPSDVEVKDLLAQPNPRKGLIDSGPRDRGPRRLCATWRPRSPSPGQQSCREPCRG